MTALSPKEAADDSRKGFALAIATLREQAIRSGSVLPSPDRPDEQRWAKEGVRPVRELETVREGWMTGGKASRQKGDRFEREIVDLFQEHGLAAERVPLSGAAGGKFSGDVSVPVLGIDRCIEAKIRKSGFGQIYAWLAGNYAVVSRRDRSDALITLRLSDFARVAAIASRNEHEVANDNYGERPFDG